MHVCISSQKYAYMYIFKKKTTPLLFPHTHKHIHACLQPVLEFMAVQRQDGIEFLQPASIKQAEKHRGGGCGVRVQVVLGYLFNKSSNNIYQIFNKIFWCL